MIDKADENARSRQFEFHGGGMIRRETAACAAVAAVASVLLTAGCSSGRSEEAFCDTMAKHRQEFESSMQQANEALDSSDDDQVLLGMAKGAASILDLRTMFSELAEVAPQEIRGDAEAVRDNLDEQADNAGGMIKDPIGGLAGSVLTAAKSAKSMERLNQYGIDKCNMRMF